MEYQKKTLILCQVFSMLGLLFLCSSQAMALRQEASTWLGINYQNYLSKDKRWVFLLHNQARLNTTHHPLQTLLTEDSIGYGLTPKHRIWVGYYWAEHEPYHHDFKEHRIWEQFYWKIEENEKQKIASRTRLEQIKFSRLSPNLIIFRQLFAKETSIFHLGPVKPLIYEEVFLRLNHPPYASNSFFSQNRVFLGVNIYCRNGTYWKVGYINQYQSNTPFFPRTMNHIFTVNYTFGEGVISLPVDN